MARLSKLKKRNLLYPCFCSRREIASAAKAADPDGAPLYSGTCRNLSESAAAERLARGERAQWRLKMDAASAEAGPMTIAEAPAPDRDALWSEITRRPADPARWGDAVLVRKDTPTSYHLSVVVDDAAQGISHVTRGIDSFGLPICMSYFSACWAFPRRSIAITGCCLMGKDKSSPNRGNPRA